ncbi:DUF2913 family protein [Rahnella woolbedingensis]|uniref:DUF2913 family protein n=1 Tax=Rahnella woolbedingensis TaxID=1510574 RepID=A0A419N346_9GAMM|nr:DUF2913 family protein [Rahnella woolbedingensis]RJT37383.1 DUF2913 family protein [Rahnella woolbedingensis]
MTLPVNPDLNHLAFCALVALSFEKQTSGISGRVAENLFLLRWLTVAQKQKRFPKSLASEIIWLINEARTKGVNVSLKDKFEVIWRTGNEDVQPHSDLYRLNAAIIALREQGWNNYLLSQAEWSSLTEGNTTEATDTLYMTKPHWKRDSMNEVCKPVR